MNKVGSLRDPTSFFVHHLILGRFFILLLLSFAKIARFAYRENGLGLRNALMPVFCTMRGRCQVGNSGAESGLGAASRVFCFTFVALPVSSDPKLCETLRSACNSSVERSPTGFELKQLLVLIGHGMSWVISFKSN